VASTVVFYDGVCGLCNRLVRFLIRRDRHARLRFAPLQGRLAHTVLPAHGRDPSDLDTIYVLANYGHAPLRLLSRSDAVLYALAELGPLWRAAAAIGRLVPRWAGDAVYDAVARRRYRTFGKLDVCPLPPPERRGRFIE
jgi:predicted DCC family thiol-disulfide oxidoreductase YuxK